MTAQIRRIRLCLSGKNNEIFQEDKFPQRYSSYCWRQLPKLVREGHIEWHMSASHNSAISCRQKWWYEADGKMHYEGKSLCL